MSVVIPTYNRRDWLPRVLTPLLDDPATTELVVVVDGSSDGSIEMLREWASREPRLRPLHQENAGQGAARQAGVEAAVGEVVVLLDDDIVAGPGLVGAHAAWHRGDVHRVVLGYTPNQAPPRRAGHAPTILYSQDYEKVHDGFERDPRTVFTDFWSGNFSIRRADVLRVGMQVEGNIGYHEDQQFGFRCRHAGLEPVFDRRIAALHLHERTLADLADECRRQGAARVELALQYPDVAGPADATTALPRPVRLAVRSTRRSPVLAAAASRALWALGEGAGRLRVSPVEVAAARLLRQVELDRGAQEALRERRPG